MSEDKTRILTAEEAARLAALPEPADDRTRVLSAEEAARILGEPEAAPRPQPAAEDREPKLVGEKIVFFCANGHRISVDRALAGKRGKCSRRGCGVSVLIPTPSGAELQPDPGPEGELPGGDVATETPAAPELAFDLVAPATPPAPDGPTAGPSPEAGAEPAWDFVAGGAAVAADQSADLGVGPDDAASGWALDIDAIDNPTAKLVARLWLERAHGGIVEVHLSGGSVIMPDFFDPAWSSGTHALFATPGPGETVTLTAVAWDQIQKVVVRQVQGKPDGMFEG